MLCVIAECNMSPCHCTQAYCLAFAHLHGCMLERKDLSCTCLAHHQLESVLLIIIVTMDDQLLSCRHTSRFLLWWLTGFPFAAWSSYGWVTPFVTAVVTFLLLGTENIGIQIEEPFEVLPIEAITAACIASVHEILERHHGEMPAYTVSVFMLTCLFAALIWVLR